MLTSQLCPRHRKMYNGGRLQALFWSSGVREPSHFPAGRPSANDAQNLNFLAYTLSITTHTLMLITPCN